jgi:hypothetical protein
MATRSARNGWEFCGFTASPVVQRAACGNLDPQILSGRVDGRDAPAVAVDLGERDEVLQDMDADGIRDGNRCGGDDTKQPAHPGDLRSKIL